MRLQHRNVAFLAWFWRVSDSVRCCRLGWHVVGSMAVILFADGKALLAQCVDYRDYIHWVGGVYVSGSVGGVATTGSYAYVAGGYTGLHLIDASKPGTPRI